MIVLRAFLLDDGQDVLSHWLYAMRSQQKVIAGLDARMVYLKDQNREGWTRPRYDILRDAEGVGEIRFKCQRLQYRALGYFGPERNEFTFLCFATKTNQFDPKDAISIATERKNVVECTNTRSVKVTRWDK